MKTKITMKYIIALALVMVAFLPAAAQADCTDPAGKKGEIVYNSQFQAFQGCTGTQWASFHDAQCPAGDCDPCKTGPLGTVCDSDGAIYAGELLGTRIYAAPEDETGTFPWGGAGEDDDADSDTDGLTNTNNLVADGHGHPAAEECRNERGAGWYLPAKDELSTLISNQDEINSSANQSFHPSDDYWSSTEGSTDNAWYMRFGGYQTSYGKNYSRRVRCIRR